MFSNLADRPADGLLALMLAYRADPRPDKIDLVLGVYRDEAGQTPVMAAVKEAEQILVERQATKVYVGVDGDQEFIRLLGARVFGGGRAADPRLAGMQTPGGNGALRLAAEFYAQVRPDGRVWISDPAWANHVPIFRAARVPVGRYRLLRDEDLALDMDAVLDGIRRADPGDGILLQGCCHNPTGIDFTPEQWRRIADLVAERRLFPIVDLAYQGLGRGLAEDAHGTRVLFDDAEALLVAYSCDKNFGLYRERTGALWVRAPEASSVRAARTAMANPARMSWSMPPDHGAAVVRTILESPSLTDRWRGELEQMRRRVATMRSELATSFRSLSHLESQTGMFAMLPVDAGQVDRLRHEHGIYIVEDGRVNLAGLNRASLARLIDALRELRLP